MHKIGKTFIVSGPSGVGKSTVLHALFQGRDDLYFSVSATTRAPREGEQDGVVLKGGGDDVLFPLAETQPRGGEQGLVVGLAAAGGEDDLPGLAA